MKQFTDCKEDIHSCSKCGLCQSVCPIYKITGNDCTVSRGQFVMLRGFLNGELKMSKTINRYLDLCLKCSACSKFCPSGIDVVDIVALAKSEYFKKSKKEKFISWLQKNFLFGFLPKLFAFFANKKASKSFNKKVVYFGGCGAKILGNSTIVNLLNSCNIEVISPDFNCCGIPFFVRGDMESFQLYMNDFFSKLEKTGVNEVVTSCASCEKTIKSYAKWGENKNYSVKNIYEYIRENNLKFKLDKKYKVTYHKPCNLNNFEDIEYLLKNTENLEYAEMDDYEKCCGLNGIPKISEYKILSKLFSNKRKNIIKTGAKYVLTSCLGCEMSLKLFSMFNYKVMDLVKFLSQNSKKQI